MDNPGLKRGLAVDFQYGQRTNDLARQNNAMRQAQIYSENKAKLLADDFDYNNAMNAWDNAAVKEFARGKLKEVGNFMRANPDFESNIEKRIAYKNLTKELKDNKTLNEGLQVDGNIKLMNDYIKDPKNAPLVQSEDFAPIKQQYENYLKTGSIDGITANRKLFTFTPPEELYDITPELMDYASKVQYDVEKKHGLGLGTGTRKFTISDERKGEAAMVILQNDKLGRKIKQQYNKYADGLGEGQKPMSLKQYTVTMMNSGFKSPKYEDYHYQVREPKDPNGDGSNLSKTGSMFSELVQAATAEKGKYVTANPKSVKELFVGDDNVFNTKGSYFEDGNGKRIPLKGAQITKFNTSGSKAKLDANGKALWITSTISVPAKDVADLFDAADPVNNPWLFGDPSVNVGYDKGMSIYKDQESGEYMVNIEIMRPFESDGKQSNQAKHAYDHGGGQGMSGAKVGVAEPVGNAQRGENGVMYMEYSDGYIRGSDGSVIKK